MVISRIVLILSVNEANNIAFSNWNYSMIPEEEEEGLNVTSFHLIPKGMPTQNIKTNRSLRSQCVFYLSPPSLMQARFDRVQIKNPSAPQTGFGNGHSANRIAALVAAGS